MLHLISVSFRIFNKYMQNLHDICVHGDKDGIYVYDLNVVASEIYNNFTSQEKDLLKQIGWTIEDGSFFLENSVMLKKYQDREKCKK